MNQDKPIKKSDLILKDLGDEFLIYSAENKELHVINQTARLIWEMCDGEHSVNDMESEIRAHFSVPQEMSIVTDIRNTINTFQEKGLLKNEN